MAQAGAKATEDDEAEEAVGKKKKTAVDKLPRHILSSSNDKVCIFFDFWKLKDNICES